MEASAAAAAAAGGLVVAEVSCSDTRGLEPVAAAVAAVAVPEAPPTYGISASVTYIAGLRAMATALVDALEGRQLGENEGREDEEGAA